MMFVCILKPFRTLHNIDAQSIRNENLHGEINILDVVKFHIKWNLRCTLSYIEIFRTLEILSVTKPKGPTKPTTH